MSITWKHGRIIADTRFNSVHGGLIADGCQIRLSVEFRVHPWHDLPLPVVRLAPAPVSLLGEQEILLGYAIPESTIPFSVTQNGSTSCVLHDLALSPGAMERIEASRTGGQSLILRLKLHGEVWIGHDAAPLHDAIECRISQSDWLTALEQCGHGQYLLFEVPVLASRDPRAPTSTKYLQQAKEQFAKGHFDDVVAVCRKALEAAIDATQTQDAQQAATKLFKSGKDKELGLEQRELVIRQAVMNLTHLAHHHEPGADVVRFDRSAAAMVLGMTSSIVARIRS